MATSSTRISLARILDLQVPVSWQEAVAVACAAGDASLVVGHGASLDTCHVTTAGQVEIVGGAWHNESLRNPVFSLLAALLDGRPAPEELVALVESQKPDSDDVLMDFLSEDEESPAGESLHDLSFFSRPDGDRLIAALAARAVAAALEVDARTVVKELREGAIDSAVPETSGPPAWLVTLQDTVRRRQRMAFGGAVAVTVAWTAWLVSSRPADIPIPSAAGATETAAPFSVETDVVPPSAPALPPPLPELRRLRPEAGPARAGSRAPAAQAPTPPVTRPTRSRAGASRPKSTAAMPPRAVSAPSRTASTPPRTASVPTRAAGHPTVELPPVAPHATANPLTAPPVANSASGPGPLSSSGAEAEAPERRVEPTGMFDSRLYSAEDPDVVPPVLLRPQIASGPRVDTEPSHAEIELVVNEEGSVTEVRMRSDGELNLNDRMLVAAAKAWRFRPAVKDGRPVRYTLTIPVTP